MKNRWPCAKMLGGGGGGGSKIRVLGWTPNFTLYTILYS